VTARRTGRAARRDNRSVRQWLPFSGADGITTVHLPTSAIRRAVGRALAGLRAAPYVRRWIVLGALIGVVAGLGAALFLAMLETGTQLLLGSLGGYFVATPAGEGGLRAASAFARPWAIPLVAAGGMVLAAVIVRKFAPEAEGHGTDAALDAVHHHPTRLRGRAAVVKMIAAALTIGAGGSGGREGPTAQISATFGSVMARALNLSPADARIAVSSGIAAGIGSIFRAPLGGAILGAELPYRDDVEVEAIVPSLVASIVGFATFGMFYGFDPIFGDLGGYHFAKLRDLLFFAALGIAAGLVGRAYIIVFHRMSAVVKGSRFPWWLKPALGGFAVGGIGLAIPGVLGTGYGDVQQVMLAPALLGLPLWVVIALPFAKILATTLTISSGGVGGIFGPGMVIGGVTGAAVWRLAQFVSDATPSSPVPFVIVGMIACFGSIAHAPLAVMLMVAEMTGNLSLLAPAMVAVALATLIVGDSTIYKAQLPNRASLPAHRLAFGPPMAAVISVGSVMTPPRVVLAATTPARDAGARLAEARVPGAPVVTSAGKYLGIVSIAALQSLSMRGPTVSVGKLADPEAMTLANTATLDQAIDAVATSECGWVPVLTPEMMPIGIVAVSDLVRGYQLGLGDATRRLARTSSGTFFAERVVTAGCPAIAPQILSLGLSRHVIILSVLRRDELIFADADTVLEEGDRLAMLARRGSDDMLDRVFGGA
jgi:H+/Cl- antiporter ClcA/CBS domain-containing protein